MLALEERYKDSICEIKSMQNDLLSTGRIYSIGEDTIELIHPDEDKMPLLPYNTPVKISIFNARLGFKMLAGVVYISTDVFLRVSDVRMLQDFERRGFFRMNVKIPTRVYPIVEDNGEEVQPMEVTLENISLSGVQISSEKTFALGDRFAMEIQLFKKKMMFHARVCRLAREDGRRQFYGCAFYDHTDRQTDDLCYDLFQLQRLEIRKRRQE